MSLYHPDLAKGPRRSSGSSFLLSSEECVSSPITAARATAAAAGGRTDGPVAFFRNAAKRRAERCSDMAIAEGSVMFI